MPGYKGHIAGAIAIYAVFVYLFAWQVSTATLLEWLIFLIAGSLFPDIDTKSRFQKMFYTLLFVALCILGFYQKYFAMAVIGVLACVPLVVHHRGLFHNIWFLIGLVGTVSAFIASLFPAYGMLVFRDAGFFLAGAISHLWFDRGFRRMF